jgi:GNAT superfamily N-acetyltransferase
LNGPDQLPIPEPLTEAHDLSEFNSGEPALDQWLRQRALHNIRVGASRTYVICADDSQRVVGFYALSMGQILNLDVTGAMRRNMPRQIPAVILGRMAIDRSRQGIGLGRLLLSDAVHRSLQAAEEVSARLIIVHAISTEAENFYVHHGFTRLPTETPSLALDLVKFRKLSGLA